MTRKRSMLASALLAVLGGLLGYLVLLALIWHRQSSLLYLADRYSLEEMGRGAAQLDLEPWPWGTKEYHGLLSATRPEASRGTVIVFHGNAGSAMDRLYYRDALEPLGFTVLLAEYPGYGAREGSPSEKSLTADGRETVRLAGMGLPAPLYLWGESLGCAVAASLARDLPDEAAGLALVTPWADLPRLAQAAYPFLPARLLTRERWDNIAGLRDFSRPVAVIMAEKDEIIPASHTLSLFDSLREPRKLWTLPGVSHNTWPSEPGRKWWREVVDFLDARRRGNG